MKKEIIFAMILLVIIPTLASAQILWNNQNETSTVVAINGSVWLGANFSYSGGLQQLILSTNETGTWLNDTYVVNSSMTGQSSRSTTFPILPYGAYQQNNYACWTWLNQTIPGDGPYSSGTHAPMDMIQCVNMTNWNFTAPIPVIKVWNVGDEPHELGNVFIDTNGYIYTAVGAGPTGYPPYSDLLVGLTVNRSLSPYNPTAFNVSYFSNVANENGFGVTGNYTDWLYPQIRELPNGTLVMFAIASQHQNPNFPEPTQFSQRWLVYLTSADNGTTWSVNHTIADEGINGNNDNAIYRGAIIQQNWTSYIAYAYNNYTGLGGLDRTGPFFFEFNWLDGTFRWENGTVIPGVAVDSNPINHTVLTNIEPFNPVFTQGPVSGLAVSGNNPTGNNTILLGFTYNDTTGNQTDDVAIWNTTSWRITPFALSGGIVESNDYVGVNPTINNATYYTVYSGTLSGGSYYYSRYESFDSGHTFTPLMNFTTTTGNTYDCSLAGFINGPFTTGCTFSINFNNVLLFLENPFRHLWTSGTTNWINGYMNWTDNLVQNDTTVAWQIFGIGVNGTSNATGIQTFLVCDGCSSSSTTTTTTTTSTTTTTTDGTATTTTTTSPVYTQGIMQNIVEEAGGSVTCYNQTNPISNLECTVGSSTANFFGTALIGSIFVVLIAVIICWKAHLPLDLSAIFIIALLVVANIGFGVPLWVTVVLVLLLMLIVGLAFAHYIRSRG